MLFIHNAVYFLGLMGGRVMCGSSHLQQLSLEWKKTQKIEKKSTPVEGCVYYIFLVKSGKISLRIRLVGLGSQIKELKID